MLQEEEERLLIVNAARRAWWVGGHGVCRWCRDSGVAGSTERQEVRVVCGCLGLWQVGELRRFAEAHKINISDCFEKDEIVNRIFRSL